MSKYDNLFSRAQHYLNSGDMKGALELLIRCAKSKRHKPRCLKMMGSIYGQLADYKSAELCFRQAVQIDTNDHELWCYLAMSMVFCDRNKPEIVSAFEKSINLCPGYANAWYGMGSLYRDMGVQEKAKECLLEAIRIDKYQINSRINLAAIHRDQGDYDAALAEFNNCITMQPQNVVALAGKALTLFYSGDIEQAEALILSLGAQHLFNPVIAAAYCEICKRGDNAYTALRYMENTLSKSNYTSLQKCDLHYAAAKLCDQLEEYDEAFRYLKLANDGLCKRLDIATFRSFLPQRKITSTLKIAPVYNGEHDLDITPIFIIGMPRSGSTLVEQVLGCHPEIYPGGELKYLYQCTVKALKENGVNDISKLDKDSLLEIRQKYISDIKEIAGNKKYVTDKLPGNYERIGLINAIFPNAKIINTNRNKLDVSLSCYFQNFGTRHPYTCDFNALVSVYQHYEDVLSIWREESEIEIYDTSYEKLISDTKVELSNILNYLNLPWSEACMAHHKSSHVAKTASFDQVRQPLYKKSMERWRNYEKHISELIAAFGSDLD